MDQVLIFLVNALLVCTISVLSETVVPVQDTKSTTLPCRAAPSTDGRTVRWFKQSSMVSIDTRVIRFNTNLKIEKSFPGEWNLKILRVTGDFEGIFTCKVNNVPKIIYRVVVEAEPRINDTASSPMSVFIQEYTTVDLYCKVEGYPVPRISWSRKSRAEAGSIKDLGISTETLTIINATRYADDIYICMAENDYGSVQREINLRILFPPEVRLFESGAEADKGQEIKMACIVQSLPLKDAYWTNQNGDRLTTNFQYIVEIESELVYDMYRFLTLTIRKDSWDETSYGQYSCNVSNGTQIAVQQFTLKRPVEGYDVDGTIIKYT